MLKVHVLYEHSNNQIHGSSIVRLLRPLNHPKLARSVLMTSGTSYEKFVPDIIIVDRLLQPDIKITDAEKLVEYTHKNRIKLIYSIDDNLLDLKLFEPGKMRPTAQEKNIIRYFIRESDGVLVSTNCLQERIKNLNKRIFVIENVLDEQLFDEKTRINSEYSNKIKDKLVMGYMGTSTHDRDFMLAIPAIKKILHKYNNNIRLEILGALSDRRLLNLLPNTSEIYEKGNNEYDAFWKWMNANVFWDFAIAPLEKNEFTKCKSDIKFLDYSALEIPGIYTKFDPYDRTIINGKTGLLVDNDTESWISALEQLIQNADLRKNLAKNARDYLFSNRTLDKCAFYWEKMLMMIQNCDN